MAWRFFLLFAIAAAQPAAATQFIEPALTASEAPAAACSANDPTCVLSATETEADQVSTGSIVSGLAGLLVLGLVFGRRRSTLQQVVS